MVQYLMLNFVSIGYQTLKLVSIPNTTLADGKRIDTVIIWYIVVVITHDTSKISTNFENNEINNTVLNETVRPLGQNRNTVNSYT